MINSISQNQNINFGTTIKKCPKLKIDHLSWIERESDTIDAAYKAIKEVSSSTKETVKCKFYACSDGSEAVHFAIKAKGENLQLEAFDINKEIFQKAKKGIFNIAFDSMDKSFFEKNKQFFKKIKWNNKPINLGFDEVRQQNIRLQKFRLDKDIRKKINFKVGDITTAFKEKQNDICAVFCKNFWYLLEDDSARKALANDLKQNLKPKSIIVLGNTEAWNGKQGLAHNMDKFLEEIGFKPIFKNKSSRTTVFQKP